MQKMYIHINKQVLRDLLEQNLDQISNLGYWNLHVLQ